MKVRAKGRRSLDAFASASSFSRGTRSTLLRTRSFSCATLPSLPKMLSASSSIPSLASISMQTRSASWDPLHAVETIARSSRLLGEKIPGVSTRMICEWPSIAMPRIRARVVCTLRETMVTLEPTSALTSVDFPTLGAPISATKPQRVEDSGSARSLSVIAAAADAFALDHDGGRDLLGRALASADALGRRQPRQVDGDAELRIVMRSGALDLSIDRRRQALALRPLLQHRLGIAQRAARLLHPLGPVARHELGCGRVAAIEKYRTDHGLTDVAEHGFAQARAGADADCTELDVIEQVERLGHLGTAFLAYEIGETFGQFALVGVRKRAIEHIGDDQPEHVIAEEFQALVALASLVRGFERRHVGDGRDQQAGIGELMPDARLDRRRRFVCRLACCLCPLLGFGLALAAFLLRYLCLVLANLIGREACFAEDRCGRDVWEVVTHRTILKMRFQRIEYGQRQKSQAFSPSAMEKKIICARPTMFSKGT